LLLSLLLLLTYNSKCNQSHNTAGPAMQSSRNPYNIENYSSTPEPFYLEHFAANKTTTAAAPAAAAPNRISSPPANYVGCLDKNKPTKPPPYFMGDNLTDRKNIEKTYRGQKIAWNMVCNQNPIVDEYFSDYNKENMDVEENFGNYDEGMTVEQMADLASVQTANEVSPQWSARANQQTQGQGPAGSFNGDSSFQPVSNMGGMGGGAGAGGSSQQGAQSCFPRDRLTADDLLPKDAADSKWAQINPSGSGNISDQNYLTAGYHVGVNTVGQSLRNANLQLRSEIPNPQNAVGPWMISTIEPDLRQNTLEIGSSISY